MSKLDGMMSRNEERAWEEWEADVLAHVATLRASADAIELAVRGPNAHQPVTADVITEAVQEADGAGEDLFRMRHGPENPETVEE